MNRRGDKEYLLSLFRKLREKIPGLVLRTSLIAGLPGEDEAAFEELCGFLQEVRIERTGVRLYQALIDKAEAVQADVALPFTIGELKHIRDEELEHMHIVTSALEGLGADPTAQTPCADVAGVASRCEPTSMPLIPNSASGVSSRRSMYEVPT